MRVSVNLATKPFVELRPLLLRLRSAGVVLLALAVGLGFWLHAQRRSAAVAESRIAVVEAQTTALNRQRQMNESRMRQPANQAVLHRSHFLNAVFARKSFSWTAVMMDLERVLPGGVEVTSIEPQVSPTDGSVVIRLRVSGDRERAVELVRNLERSSRFVRPRLANEAAQVAEGTVRNAALQTGAAPGSVEFDILSGYNPLPDPAKAPGTSGAAKVQGAGGSGSSAAGRRAHPAGAPRATHAVPGSAR